VDFEVTTKDGSFAVAQTFNQTPDADGYLNNDTNWADLKSQLDAIPGVSASIINRTWTTGVAPALVFHSEASYLSISLSTSTGVWFENTTQSVNENWSLSGTSMNTAGKSYLSIPGVMFNDASGQNPSAFRVDTSGATSKSLVDFTTPRISVSRLTLDGIEAPFTLTGTGGVLSGSLSATSAGVTQTGISFDAWHPYEITTTDASGSLFQSLVNHSHLKPLDEVDLTDVSELDDALVVMDKTLERIVYQRQQDGIGIEKMRISGRLMAEQGAQIKQVQSNIQDADYAVELAQLAKSQILKSASSSMMAHEIDRIKKSVEYFFNGTK
jgi:flagellin